MRRVWHFLIPAHESQDEYKGHEPHITFSSPQTIPAEMIVHRDRLGKEILRWIASFTPIFAHSQTFEGRRDFTGATVLLIWAKSSLVTLETHVQGIGEMIYDQFDPAFVEILALCKTIIEPPSSSRLSPPREKEARFSSDLGIIPILFWVAIKCRHSFTRHEAIRLLQVAPRREGIWDSLLTAKASSWIVEIEEAGMTPDGYVPPQSRVCITSINCLLSHWEQLSRQKQGTFDIKLVEVHCNSDIFSNNAIQAWEGRVET